MKKIIISVVLCLGIIIPSMAQDASDSKAVVNKKGVAILPQAGDFALGIDASPFLSYIGNMFNGNVGNNSPSFQGLSHLNNSNIYGIYGKYFLEDNRAVRAKVSFAFGQDKYKEDIGDDYVGVTDPTNAAATAVDVQTVKYRQINLDLGYEFRRGKGRLQAFYGGELLLGYNRDVVKYNYGNPMTGTGIPTTADFSASGGYPQDNLGVSAGYRALQYNYGPTISAGLGGFVGVEYFIAPQFSIGGELNLGFVYSITSQSEVKTEGVLNGSVQEYEYRERNMDDSVFEASFSTRPFGGIFLMFYF